MGPVQPRAAERSRTDLSEHVKKYLGKLHPYVLLPHPFRTLLWEALPVPILPGDFKDWQYWLLWSSLLGSTGSAGSSSRGFLVFSVLF